MSADPVGLETAARPWARRRSRAAQLRARHAFADEVLTLYLALLDVQEDAWTRARESPPRAEEIVPWAAARILPAVVEVTLASGPAALGEAASGRLGQAAAEGALAGWLAGAELDPVDRYLARASLGPVLEALGEDAEDVCVPQGDPEHRHRCPGCGGLPQLSVLADAGEELVTGPRNLLCCRCGTDWQCSRSTCPACGGSEEEQLQVYAEQLEGPVSGNGKRDGDAPPVFPHLRIAGCSACRRYLIEVDMARDPRAVPEVDELAALPLDLYAADQGLTKVTPNLMGF
jgi:hypothetical protein